MKSKWIVIPILILALLVLCVAIGAIIYTAFRPVTNSRALFFNARPFTQSVQEIEQKNFPVTGEAFLNLDNTFGDVTITAGPVSEIQVTATKTTWGATDEQAKESMENLVLVMTQKENQVTIRVEEPERVNFSSDAQANTVDFDIVVPAETTVDAATRSGDVSLTGTQGKAVLDSSFGDITVFDTKGGLLATSRSGNVSARRIHLLDSGFGDVSLQSDFGDVTLEEAVTQKADAYSRSGDVDLTNVTADGDIKLTSDFGGITFRTGKAGSLTVETRSGAVRLVDLSVSGLLTAKSSFGDVELDSADALSYDLDTSSGSVTANGTRGAVKARSGFGDIEIEGGDQATLDLETKNGKIIYTGSLGEGPHYLHTDFGDITLTMPGDTTFNFDLQTDFGSIESDFEVKIDGDPDEDHWVGEVNGGGASITASTRGGNVELTIGN